MAFIFNCYDIGECACVWIQLLDPTIVLSSHDMGQLDELKPLRRINVQSFQPRTVQALKEPEKRVRTLICKPVTSAFAFVCCTFTWEHNNFKNTFFWDLRSGKVSGTAVVQQYRGSIFIYTINHFVPKVRWDDLEKRKQIQRERGQGKRGRRVVDEDREKALVML